MELSTVTPEGDQRDADANLRRMLKLLSASSRRSTWNVAFSCDLYTWWFREAVVSERAARTYRMSTTDHGTSVPRGTIFLVSQRRPSRRNLTKVRRKAWRGSTLPLFHVEHRRMGVSAVKHGIAKKSAATEAKFRTLTERRSCRRKSTFHVKRRCRMY